MAANKRTIHIQYYAALREQAGRSGETVQTSADTPAALYAELRGAHGLRLERDILRVAVNDAFGSWDQPLQDDDRVVFIPPVAGG